MHVAHIVGWPQATSPVSWFMFLALVSFVFGFFVFLCVVFHWCLCFLLLCVVVFFAGRPHAGAPPNTKNQ